MNMSPMGPGHLGFVTDMLGNRSANAFSKNVVYVKVPTFYLIDSSSNILGTSANDRFIYA